MISNEYRDTTTTKHGRTKHLSQHTKAFPETQNSDTLIRRKISIKFRYITESKTMLL